MSVCPGLALNFECLDPERSFLASEYIGQKRLSGSSGQGQGQGRRSKKRVCIFRSRVVRLRAKGNIFSHILLGKSDESLLETI